MKFDPAKFPSEIPRQWIDGANRGILLMRERLVDKIEYRNISHFEICCRWVEIYLQAHIRRALNLIEGGLAELHANRPIIAALCARALIEDGAMVWHFQRRVNVFLDDKDTNGLESFVFSRALQSRDTKHIEEYGEEYRATNILTSIDQMTKQHPNVRRWYDELSEVCHPNQDGVLWHCADIDGESSAAQFDDRVEAESALRFLLFGALTFLGEDTAMRRLEQRMKEMCGR